MYGNLGEGVVGLFFVLFFFSILGLWKAVEIILWLIHHISIAVV